MLVLSADDQRKTITMKEAIDSVALALLEFSKGRTDSPIRTAIPIKQEAAALFMPSYIDETNSLGIKIVSVFPQNKALGKSTISGLMILLDTDTGQPLALMEASYLTILRTGAVTGLATKYLASKEAKKLAVIGTGAQLRGLIEAIITVRQIEEITLFNRSQQKAEQLRLEISKKYPDTKIVIDKTSQEAIQNADIIVTATNSYETVINGPIAEGIHINAIGSFKPSMQEIPTHIVKKANKIVVESKEAALEEIGDIIIPIREGVLTPDDIYAELGEIVLGNRNGRQSEQEVTIFKSVGFAPMDVAVAKTIYDRAVSLDLGTSVKF
ncbi:MAG TPA: ornithine cyclodeaminase family protein [Bacillus sp. (in: firmicutes)]|nr:ornithine cyclodeaminase family protein [Bacillus sp. (in: firmicutes)]